MNVYRIEIEKLDARDCSADGEVVYRMNYHLVHYVARDIHQAMDEAIKSGIHVNDIIEIKRICEGAKILPIAGAA